MENKNSALSLSDNVFKRRRVTLGLSQRELGHRAGVSSPCITDLEVGLYRKPPPALLKALSASPEDERLLELSYYSWVTETRYNNSRLFQEIPVLSFTQYMQESGGTLRGFCRNLVAQRSLVQDYVKKARNWNYISQCLYQVKLSSDYVAYLRSLPR